MVETLIVGAFVLLAGAVLALWHQTARLRYETNAVLDWCTARVAEAKKAQSLLQVEVRAARRREILLTDQLLRMKRDGFERQPADVDEPCRTWRITNADEVAIDRARKAERTRQMMQLQTAERTVLQDVLDDLDAEEAEHAD